MTLPACPVRGCGLLLERQAGQVACVSGHSFDVARTGHLNLLQPQDRRSKEPGDAAEAVAARARCLEAGCGSALAASVVDLVARHAGGGRPSVLDIGCGEGYFLRELAASREIDACGIDLSSRAASRAARGMPSALFVVANADRALPWPDCSFDVLLSITARRPVSEMRRVSRPGAVVVVAIPAEDDLIELREAVLGRGERRDRLALLRAEMGACFREVEHRSVRVRVPATPALQQDLIASTYRGGRGSRRERISELAGQEVTLAQEIVAWTLP